MKTNKTLLGIGIVLAIGWYFYGKRPKKQEVIPRTLETEETPSGGAPVSRGMGRTSAPISRPIASQATAASAPATSSTPTTSSAAPSAATQTSTAVNVVTGQRVEPAMPKAPTGRTATATNRIFSTEHFSKPAVTPNLTPAPKIATPSEAPKVG